MPKKSPLQTFLKILMVLGILGFVALALTVSAFIAAFTPIDKGFDIGHLATAGLLRGAV